MNQIWRFCQEHPNDIFAMIGLWALIVGGYFFVRMLLRFYDAD